MRLVFIGFISGILFLIMAGIINANPYAQHLYEAYKPIMRHTFNFSFNVFIYIVYGISMASIFLWLYKSLPGKTAILKGMSFGTIAWFFHGFMSVMGQWMTFNIPAKSLIYGLITGLFEMLIIGMLYGLTLKRSSPN
jgi:hypothetical protein